MKRLILGVIGPALALCVLFGVSIARTDAAVEFCPASAGAFTPLDGKESATLYSFTLSANGKRHAVADVAVQTSAGWYDVAVPSTAIVERDERYRDPAVEFVRREFSSAPIYVRFPNAVTVLGAFVRSASAADDSVFGWAPRGTVACQAPAGFGVTPTNRPKPDASFAVTPVDPQADASALPGTDVPIIAAAPTGSPGSTSCAVPSKPAMVSHVRPPAFPYGYQLNGMLDVLVKVAVDAQGTLADASIFVPSGSVAFDNAALDAAKNSTYTAGSSFCEPAPGTYLFRVDFKAR